MLRNFCLELTAWSISDRINFWVAAGTLLLAIVAFIQILLLRRQVNLQWRQIQSDLLLNEQKTAFEKAKNTWEITESIFNNPYSFDGLHLIEYNYYDYKPHYSITFERITWEQVALALRIDGSPHFTSVEIYIKEYCLDNLLRRLDRLEQAIANQLASWEYVDSTLKYYIKMIRRDRSKEIIIRYSKNAMPNACALISDESKYPI